MNFITTLIGDPYGAIIKYGAIAIGAIGIVLSIYFYGVHVGKAESQAQVITKIITQTKAAGAESNDLAKVITVNHDVLRTVIQKVPIYVTNNTACDLNADAIGLLNTQRHAMSATDGDTQPSTGTTPSNDPNH